MSPALVTYAALLTAIGFEVVGTTLLQASQQFTRAWPTVGALGCYAVAIFLLSISLRTLPVGIAYAIWSGLGIVLISTVGFVLYRQRLDTAALIGLGLIIAGVLVVNVFSKSVSH